jgi:hypothetical protein
MYAIFSAARPDSAIAQVQQEHWTLGDHLMATILDRVNLLLWSKTKDAHKKPPRNMPKRIPRPGVTDRKKLHPHTKVVAIEDFIQRQIESGRVRNA